MPGPHVPGYAATHIEKATDAVRCSFDLGQDLRPAVRAHLEHRLPDFRKNCPCEKNASSPAPDGTTWTTAFASVKPAIAAASSGDELWVAAATYDSIITLKAGVSLHGGFTGSETAREQRSAAAAVTVLDGDGSAFGPGITVDTGAGLDTVIDGFTIRGIVRSGSVGGGILLVGPFPRSLTTLSRTTRHCTARASPARKARTRRSRTTSSRIATAFTTADTG